MGQMPTKPMPGAKFQVIGAGMSRTGTKTLNEALTILLGGPVHDSGVHSTGGTFKQIRQWGQVMELVAKKEKTYADKKHIQYLLADLLEGYVATMDCPAAALTPELMETFPDAYVIATTRSPKSWWRSMQDMMTMTSNYHLPFVLLWVPKVNQYGIWREKFKKLAIFRYGLDMFNEGSLELHEDHLREVVPKDRLHWYEVKDGWEPLCKILNLPIPDVPFPHNNSRDDARKTYNQLLFAGFLGWCAFFAVSYTFYWYFWG
ncbi:hypothetical protein jhhlp_008407 [Lomentospora prolificans]|uniref:NAD dependent epimerase/dehydratase n=1 Tax=Lomentospora prolificans TaxID=41688 RepID=A0A2N3MXY4_9PEZI|nr:hypothetical protein jhhlp_008407 [Lomentospora prolificans]